MRWAIGFLIVINVTIFLWGSLTQDTGSGERPWRATPTLPSLEILPTPGDRATPARTPTQSSTIAASDPAPPTAGAGAPSDRLPAAPESPLPAFAATARPSATDELSRASTRADGDPSPRDSVGDDLILDTDLGPTAGTDRTETASVPMSRRLYCGRLGPIPEIATAEATKDRLDQAGLRPVVQEIVEPRNKGFWVLIPPLANRAEGQQMVARLHAKGVKDMWLFRRGELNNAISLGLYNRRSNAEARSKQLEALGFEVEVWPRLESVSHYHVSYSGTTFEVFDQVRDLVPEFDNSDTACARVAAAK